MQRIKSNIVTIKLLFLLELSLKMQFSNIDNEVTFYQGKQGKYYVIDGEKYDIHFPLYWATCHNGAYPEDIAGPKSCLNCKEYGSVNGVFVAYCLNCAYHVFEETREGSDGTPESLQNLSYLRDVPISEIGDVYKEDYSDDYCIEVIEEDCEDWSEAIDPNLVSVDDLYRENDSNDCIDEDDIYCDLYYDNDRREREMRFNRKEYHNTPASLVF